jgi:hypothetical protein
VSLFLLFDEVGGCYFGALGLLPALGCSSSSLSGCGVWSVFVFWRLGVLPTLRCLSIWFFVWVFCPSVASLFFLVAVVGNCPLLLVAAVGVSLLAPCGFCPPWGVSGSAVGVGVFVD